MISSTQNPLIKTVRKLIKERKAREEAGQFVVEGIQGVVEAVERNVPLHTILYAPDTLTSSRAHEAIHTAQQRGVRVEPITAEVFASLSERDHPIGILAIASRPSIAIPETQLPPETLLVALYETSDPGNLGTILRTADAVGAQGVLLVGNTVDPFHPAVVKASAGTIFSVPLIRIPSLAELTAWCEARGLHLIASTDKATDSYWDAEYPQPLVLLMGAEAQGLPSDFLATMTHTVRIPMHGAADSLNLAVATGLILYEIKRRYKNSP
jgi:TrmH family RNA methyltransferase